MIAQIETCSTCPYFEDYYEASKRGWCHAFDHQARTHHTRTNDCDQAIQALEEKEAIATQAIAQQELDQYIEAQSEAVAPQPVFTYRLSDSFFQEYQVYLGDSEAQQQSAVRYLGKVSGMGGWRHSRQSFASDSYSSQSEAASALFRLLESEKAIFDDCNEMMLSRFM